MADEATPFADAAQQFGLERVTAEPAQAKPDFGAVARQMGLEPATAEPTPPKPDFAGAAKSIGLQRVSTPAATQEPAPLNFGKMAQQLGMEKVPNPYDRPPAPGGQPPRIPGLNAPNPDESAIGMSDHGFSVPRTTLRSPAMQTGDLGPYMSAVMKHSIIPPIPESSDDAKSYTQVPLPGTGLTVPVRTDLFKKVANVATGQVTPETGAWMIAGEGLGAAAKWAINTPAAQALLRNAAPAVQKMFNIAARAAVPTAFGAKQTIETVQQGSAYYQAQQEADQATAAGDTQLASQKKQEAQNHAIAAGTNAVMALLSFAGAAGAGKATADIYPPAPEMPKPIRVGNVTIDPASAGAEPMSPVKPGEAAATAASLHTVGEHLAAGQWEALDPKAAIPIIVDGKALYLHPPETVRVPQTDTPPDETYAPDPSKPWLTKPGLIEGSGPGTPKLGPDGQPLYSKFAAVRVTDAHGNTVQALSPEGMTGWLRQKGVIGEADPAPGPQGEFGTTLSPPTTMDEFGNPVKVPYFQTARGTQPLLDWMKPPVAQPTPIRGPAVAGAPEGSPTPEPSTSGTPTAEPSGTAAPSQPAATAPEAPKIQKGSEFDFGPRGKYKVTAVTPNTVTVNITGGAAQDSSNKDNQLKGVPMPMGAFQQMVAESYGPKVTTATTPEPPKVVTATTPPAAKTPQPATSATPPPAPVSNDTGTAEPASASTPAEVRARALQAVTENPEQLLAEYKERFGNVLNADNAAELFPDYDASNEARLKFRTAVHPAAQWVRDELYSRALANPDVKEVVFTAGGNGAGKSTTGLGGDVVMDTTLSNPEHAERLVQGALDAGKRVQVSYTYRPIMDALNGVLDRAMEHGRTVPISTLVKTHEGAAATMRALHQKYDDNPNIAFRFIDNSGDKPVLGDLALTQKENYGEKRDQLYAELERRRPDLPESIYEATKGSGPGSEGGRTGGPGNPQPPGSPRQSGEGSKPEVTAPPSAPSPTLQSLAEFRKRPDATSVPSNSVLASNLDKENVETLQRWSKKELQILAKLLGSHQSGSKIAIAQHAMNIWKIRTELKDATVESLEAKPGKDLRRYLDYLDLYKHGNKRVAATGIINWRNERRATATAEVTKAKWLQTIIRAVAAGETIPEEIQNELRSRGDEWALERPESKPEAKEPATIPEAKAAPAETPEAKVEAAPEVKAEPTDKAAEWRALYDSARKQGATEKEARQLTERRLGPEPKAEEPEEKPTKLTISYGSTPISTVAGPAEKPAEKLNGKATNNAERWFPVTATVTGEQITASVKATKPDAEYLTPGNIPNGKITITRAEWAATEKHPNPYYPQTKLVERKMTEAGLAHFDEDGGMVSERVAGSMVQAIREAMQPAVTDEQLRTAIRMLEGRTQAASLPNKVEKEFKPEVLLTLRKRGYVIQQGGNRAYVPTVSGLLFAKKVDLATPAAKPEAETPTPAPTALTPRAQKIADNEKKQAEVEAKIKAAELEKAPAKNQSFKVVMYDHGKWTSNEQRFATQEEAQDAGFELQGRWMGMPSEWNVAPAEEPVNWRFDKQKYRAVSLREKPEPEYNETANNVIQGAIDGLREKYADAERHLLNRPDDKGGLRVSLEQLEKRLPAARELLEKIKDADPKLIEALHAAVHQAQLAIEVHAPAAPAELDLAALNGGGAAQEALDKALDDALNASLGITPAPAEKPIQPGDYIRWTDSTGRVSEGRVDSDNGKDWRVQVSPSGNVQYIPKEYAGRKPEKINLSSKPAPSTQHPAPAAAKPLPPKIKRGLKKPAAPSPAVVRRRDYYTPGNVVMGYGGQLDKVLGYNEKPDGRWYATVQAVRPDGSIDPNDTRIRTHSTEPAKTDRVVSRGEVSPAPPLAPSPAPKPIATPFDDAAAKARKELEAMFSGEQLNAGIDPKALLNLGLIGAQTMMRGAVQFKDWSARMLEDLGGFVRATAAKAKTTVDTVLRAVHQFAARAVLKHGVAVEAAPPAAEEKPTIESHGTDAGVGGETGSPGLGLRPEGTGPLAGVSSENVPGTPGTGETVPGSVGGFDPHTGSPAGTPVRGGRPESEDELRPGAGDSVPGVVPPAVRGRPAQPDLQSVPAPAGLSGDYRISQDAAAQIESGGAKPKARANLEAIRTIKQIMAEGNRPATLEEQQKIARYVGWGMSELQGIFKNNKDWAGIREELENLLTPEEYKTAEQSVLNAHYTRRDVAAAMWDTLRAMGFRAGGSVIEPGMGIGNFFMTMPEDLLPSTSRTGIEMDLITGAMAKALFPGSNILIKPFQQTNLPDGYFDVAIGNVPFAGHAVTDEAFKRKPYLTANVHNYFFAKAMEKLRPGGVMLAITSRYTMDSKDHAFRNWMNEQAELLGAIRLPNDTFKANAGTQVTVDIIALRKRLPDGMSIAQFEGRPEHKWAESPELTTKDGFKVDVNEYFHAHPEMMMGEMSGGTMYRKGYPELKGTFSLEQLKELLGTLPQDVIASWQRPADSSDALAEDYPAAADIKNHQYAMVKGALVQRDGAYMRPVPLKGRKLERMKGLIELRGAAREAIRSQRLDLPEPEILAARQKLNDVYDAFVKAQGPVNGLTNTQIFSDDPDWPVLSGLLEDYDKQGVKDARAALKGKDPNYFISAKGAVMVGVPGSKQPIVVAQKRPIFRERTIQKPQRIAHVETGAEALAVSLNDHNRIDWDRMQELTGREPSELQKELAGKIFRDPISRQWETADEYLSGNVRQKLKDAEFAAVDHPEFALNAEALKAVQPVWKPAGKIKAPLGATWVPDTDYSQFAEEVLKSETMRGDQSVRFVPLTGTFAVRPSWVFTDNGIANNTEYGTPYFNGAELFEMALNGKTPVARDYYEDENGNEKSVKNADATIEANEKQQRLKDKFSAWLWSDPARAERLAQKFNWEHNNLRLREYDGTHMTFPGLNRTWLRSGGPEPHQANAVWRTLQSGNTLYAHAVGAGKTLEGVMAAMELRRLGLAKKPAMVVPNHLVGQWRDDWMRAYPGAQILVPTKKDFEKQNRQKLMARIASGNYDGVIVGHQSFGKLPVKDETFQDFIDSQLKEIEDALEAVRHGISEKDQRTNPTLKQLLRRKNALEARLKKRLDRAEKDTGLSFEELGIDHIFVDEADLFKNLGYMTMMDRIAGLPNSDSDRAMDMLLKTNYVANLHGGSRGVVFMTGTPVSNSIAEIWTVMRYLMPQYLERVGMDNFDAWAKTFGQTRTQMEVAPEGGRFIQRTRFAKFQNAGQMMNMFRLVADIRTAKQLNLPVPAIWKGGYVDQVAPNTPEMKEFSDSVGERADAVRGGNVDPSVDNMLKISSDGRKASLDMRLVAPNIYTPIPAEKQGTKGNPSALKAQAPVKWTNPEGITTVAYVHAPYNGPSDGDVSIWASVPGLPAPVRVDVPRDQLEPVVEAKRPDNPTSKVNLAVKNVLDVYKEFGAHKATQLIFLDLSTPKSEKVSKKKKASGQVANTDEAPAPAPVDEETEAANIYGEKEEPEEEEVETKEEAQERFTVYQDIKNKLMAGGMKPEEIAFIQDAKTDPQKEDLFDKMNRGQVRVLLGSTEKMGAGMNVQKLLVALHHLDAPWRPRDMMQRDGRIVRQGNKMWDDHKIPVRLYRYLTEGSFDAFMWETLAAKAGPIEQLMEGDPSLDDIDELSPLVLSYDQAKAISSGNPLIRDKILTDQEVHKLEVMRGGWLTDQASMGRQLGEVGPQIDTHQRAIAAFQQDIATREANPGMVVNGTTYENIRSGRTAPAGDALLALLQGLGAIEENTPIAASYRGFSLTATPKTEMVEVGAPHTEEKSFHVKATHARIEQPDGKFMYYALRTEGFSLNSLRVRPSDLKAVDQKTAEALHAVWSNPKKWDTDRKNIYTAEPNLNLKAASGTYVVHVNHASAMGTIQSLQYQTSFEDSLKSATDQLRRLEKSKVELESKQGEPFLYEAKLQELQRKQAELAHALGENEDDRQALGAAEEGDQRNPLTALLKDPNFSLHAKRFPTRKYFARSDYGHAYTVDGRAVTKYLGVHSVKGPHKGDSPTWTVDHMPSGMKLRQGLANDYTAVAFARQAQQAFDWNWSAPPAGFAEQFQDWSKGFKAPTETPEESQARLDAVKNAGKPLPGAQGDMALELRRQEIEQGHEVDRLDNALNALKEGADDEGQLYHAVKALGLDPDAGDSPEEEIAKGEQKFEEAVKARQDTRRKLGGLFVEQPERKGVRERGSVPAKILTAPLTIAEKFVRQDVIPSMIAAAHGIVSAKADIQRILAPSMVPGGETGALILRQRAAELAQGTDRAEKALHTLRRYLDSRTEQQNYDLMDRIESGNLAGGDAAENAFAGIARWMLDNRRDLVQALGTGKLQSFYQNYFPHIWADPAKAQATIASIFAKRPLEGKKSFLKKRSIVTIKDGLAAGLKLASTNPVDLVLTKVREMDKYLMAHHAMDDLKSEGLLHFVRAGEHAPDGYDEIKDAVATVYGPKHGAVGLPAGANIGPDDVTVFGQRIMGKYYAPAPVAALVNNYLSPGLRDKSGLFRAYLGLGNVMNQFQLGYSAFHLTFTTLDAMTSKLALALYQAGHGDVGKALATAVQTPIAPFLNLALGNKMLKEWYEPGTQGAQIAAMVDAMLQAGGRARMDSFFRTNMTAKMLEAFRKGNVLGGIVRSPMALTEQMAKPIMEWIVPRLKMGVFADMARYELERLGHGGAPGSVSVNPASAREVQAALARAWDSVDNRMGQLVYDNLFWNKVTKDLAMASIRSVGWNLGTERELGGGLLDYGRQAARVAGAGGGKVRQLLGGKGYTDPKPEVTPRMAYVAALPILVGLIGAIMTYLMSADHHAPKDLKDLYAPKDRNGKRWMIASYMKDVYGYSHHPLNTIEGKIHPLAGLIWEMLNNKDFFGKEIRNPDDPIIKQLEDQLKQIGEAYEPMGVRMMHQGGKRKPMVGMEKVLPFIGVTPAPKEIDSPAKAHRRIFHR